MTYQPGRKFWQKKVGLVLIVVLLSGHRRTSADGDIFHQDVRMKIFGTPPGRFWARRSPHRWASRDLASDRQAQAGFPPLWW